jgi:alpha-tubulin suppressor-like RCC1 family protein
MSPRGFGRCRVRALLLLLVALALGLTWISTARAATGTLDLQPPQTFSAGEHSLAVKADGSLWAWGINTYGAIGDGTTETRVVPTRIGTDTGWVAVASGVYSSLALRSDGSLWAWGSNVAGQLGDGTTTDRSVPTRVGIDNDWAAIAAGSAFSLALKSDGSLWAWGHNGSGRLGDGTTTNRSSPARIGTDDDWVRVAAGSSYCLALKADGSLWAWGNNESGQLGDGTTDGLQVPTRIGTESDWVAVSAGSGHSLALKADGSLWAWGGNAWGQLGDGTTTERDVPTRIGGDTDWASVACGPDHSLALKTDGSLWAWGNNAKGELGDGTIDQRPTPTRVGTGTGWIAISAGGFGAYNGGVSLGLKAGGTLAAWGFGRHGELGDGGRENQITPVDVLPGVKLPAAAFLDIAASPYKAAIGGLADAGIVGGFADGTFRPADPVTRQQFAKMIVRTLGLTVTGTEVCPFTDVAAQIGTDPLYPSKYVAVCAASGITVGTTPTDFAPKAAVTRAQLATMVVRAAQNGGVDLKPLGSDYSGPFNDYTNATHGANVHLADYNGLLAGLAVTGDPGAWLAGSATRGEVAQVLWNLRQLGAD